MENARSIVYEILRDIESRAYATSSDKSPQVQQFHDEQKKIEDRVLLAFSHGSPPQSLSLIRDLLGNEFVQYMEQGSSGPLARKNRDRLQLLYKRLALILETYRYLKKVSQTAVHEAACLRQIKHELVETQVAQVHEAEELERQLRDYQMLIMIVLEPFEQAMRTAMTFLEAQQLEVFLFDDDRLLAAELKTDGKTFIYNREEEKPGIPEEVREARLQEVQELTIEMPLVVEGQQIGHYRIKRTITGDCSREQWQSNVAWITPVLARIIESNRNRLQTHKVYIDDLTLLYNKRKLNEQMGKLFKRFKQGEKQLHIAMMDIDRFKALNDTHGHPVGDEILRQTARLIKEEVPYAYRYGGEEFAAVFPGYDRDRTMEIIERLRKRIEQTPYRINGEEFHITISAGVAQFETYMHSVMDAIDRADQALYASKEDGRNRCTCYDDVKDRLSADAAKMRQQLRAKTDQVDRLEQENIRLSEALKRERRKHKTGNQEERA